MRKISLIRLIPFLLLLLVPEKLTSQADSRSLAGKRIYIWREVNAGGTCVMASVALSFGHAKNS